METKYFFLSILLIATLTTTSIHSDRKKTKSLENKNELVNYKDGQPESVKYHALPALLLNEYQQQQKTIDKHDTQFGRLSNYANLQDKQIADIIERLTEVETQLNRNTKK